MWSVSRRFQLMIVFVLFFAVACNGAEESGSAEPTPTTPAATSEPAAIPDNGLALVDAVDLLIMESFPVQINAIVQGDLLDSCTTIDSITQSREDNKFTVTLTTKRDADAVCNQVLTPYQEIVSLDVTDLPSGNYTVTINGIIEGFTLNADNIVPTEIPPTPAVATPVVEPTAVAAVEATGPGGISGIVWHDLCNPGNGDDAAPSADCVEAEDGTFLANGTLEENEPPLEGVQVTLGSGACPVSEALAITISDADGAYAFSDVAAGDYCVSINAAELPNDGLLLPGRWTNPTDADGFMAVSVAAGTTTDLTNFGWDFEFLPASEGSAAATPNCIDIVSFAGDLNIPDDTIMEPGFEFEKKWRIINSGSCVWNSDYKLAFATGDQMDADNSTAINAIVQPGESLDVSVVLTTPTEPGTYRSDWQLQNGQDQLLGLDGKPDETLWTQIVVVEAGTLGSVSGYMWADECDSSLYTFGDSTLPPGCTTNANGTVRGDSVRSNTEVEMEGVIITLGSGECGSAETLSVTLTDKLGVYSFDNLAPGTYCVFVDVIEPGNFELLVPGATTFPAPGKTGTTIILEAGDTLEDVNFAWDYQEVIADE